MDALSDYRFEWGGLMDALSDYHLIIYLDQSYTISWSIDTLEYLSSLNFYFKSKVKLEFTSIKIFFINNFTISNSSKLYLRIL